MAAFLVVSDDQHKAFINAEMIAAVRARKDENGNVLEDGEVEIELVTGSKTRLVGTPAQHFWQAFEKFKRQPILGPK